MTKYTFDFIKKVVQEYLDGESGTLYLSKKYVMLTYGAYE